MNNPNLSEPVTILRDGDKIVLWIEDEWLDQRKYTLPLDVALNAARRLETLCNRENEPFKRRGA